MSDRGQQEIDRLQKQVYKRVMANRKYDPDQERRLSFLRETHQNYVSDMGEQAKAPFWGFYQNAPIPYLFDSKEDRAEAYGSWRLSYLKCMERFESGVSPHSVGTGSNHFGLGFDTQCRIMSCLLLALMRELDFVEDEVANMISRKMGFLDADRIMQGRPIADYSMIHVHRANVMEKKVYTPDQVYPTSRASAVVIPGIIKYGQDSIVCYVPVESELTKKEDARLANLLTDMTIFVCHAGSRMTFDVMLTSLASFTYVNVHECTYAEEIIRATGGKSLFSYVLDRIIDNNGFWSYMGGSEFRKPVCNERTIPLAKAIWDGEDDWFALHDALAEESDNAVLMALAAGHVKSPRTSWLIRELILGDSDGQG